MQRGEIMDVLNVGYGFSHRRQFVYHLDNEHSSRGENGNGTKEIPENAQGRPS